MGRTPHEVPRIRKARDHPAGRAVGFAGAADPTLAKHGIPRATFDRWYDLYRTGGPEALDDRHPRPDRVGTAFPTMSVSASSAWRWTSRRCRRATDTEGYFVS